MLMPPKLGGSACAATSFASRRRLNHRRKACHSGASASPGSSSSVRCRGPRDASPADDDGHCLVGEATVGVLRFGHGAGQSGNGTVCPLSACEQSSKNWMLPSVTNEWQREHSNRLPGSSGCAALYVHQHSSPGLWCDA